MRTNQIKAYTFKRPSLSRELTEGETEEVNVEKTLVNLFPIRVEWRKEDTNLLVARLYIDLSKAFDTVNHQILWDKLQHYGIPGIVFDLFSDYLKTDNN